LALSDNLTNQQVQSPVVQSPVVQSPVVQFPVVQSPVVQSRDKQIGDRLNLGQQVESAEVTETWEDLVKKEEDEPDELLSDRYMEEQTS